MSPPSNENLLRRDRKGCTETYPEGDLKMGTENEISMSQGLARISGNHQRLGEKNHVVSPS